MDRAAHFFILSVIFLLCLLPVICSQSALEYIRVFSGNAITNMTIYKNRGGNKVYVLHFSTEHWSVLATDRLQRTTKLSRQNNCTWASNAGPYHADGSSVGLVVSQGEIRHESYGGVGFGLTEDNTQWVIGTPNRSDVPYLSEFVTGFDWLVRDGAMVNSTDTTGAVLAARTAIGVDDEGRLLLMIIDGCEKW
ncbi:hypothetical protein FisN_1Hh047 [Fistulifera solaris]|uniref:Phosphodiester glycosidase domain-containing protein n=1 Tax=Fistulifera solaris TaxID=1519565 RepID=A0A1Z5JE14_FISSO|nr:hypothetical protein FisN_1Hh047 [Fistulifera solaris]|eukprot:GAX12122.1 hypothetical protein FisN_1Hh047 [Fistulifera solaris]